jgi:CheY-like chemotaxis protein
MGRHPLVVDDDASFRALVTTPWHGRDIEMRAASSGAEARAAAPGKRPALVLLEISGLRALPRAARRVRGRTCRSSSSRERGPSAPTGPPAPSAAPTTAVIAAGASSASRISRGFVDEVPGVLGMEGRAPGSGSSLPQRPQTRSASGLRSMELAGLEPATSWVRSRSTAVPKPLQKRVSGQSSAPQPLGYPALTRGFWG